jgi:hypothetical protein
MLRATILTGAFLALVVPQGELQAQLGFAPAPGDEVATIAVLGGALSPRTTFDDGSTFATGAGAGMSLTGWANGLLGFRATLFRSTHDGQNESDPLSAIAVNDPIVWTGTAEVVLRRTMGKWFPYVSGGVAGKSYTWASRHVGDVTSGWTAAGGIEVRPNILGRIGLIAELRNTYSQFNLFGHGKHYNFFTDSEYGEHFNVDEMGAMIGASITF